MNLALSDEQEFLRDAARGALARHQTTQAGREGADSAPPAFFISAGAMRPKAPVYSRGPGMTVWMTEIGKRR